jgi:hypothetical protein
MRADEAAEEDRDQFLDQQPEQSDVVAAVRDYETIQHADGIVYRRGWRRIGIDIRFGGKEGTLIGFSTITSITIQGDIETE